MKEIVSVKAMIEEAMSKSKTLRLSIIKGSWKNIVGKFALKSEPLGIKEGILFTAVENSIFLHAMEMNKSNYMEKINILLKGEYITDIKYRVRKIDLSFKMEYGHIFENEDIDNNEITEFKTKNMSLEESIKYLSELSKKREALLLKKGYKKCKNCNSLFLGTEDICPKCRGEKESVTINRN